MIGLLLVVLTTPLTITTETDQEIGKTTHQTSTSNVAIEAEDSENNTKVSGSQSRRSLAASGLQSRPCKPSR